MPTDDTYSVALDESTMRNILDKIDNEDDEGDLFDDYFDEDLDEMHDYS